MGTNCNALRVLQIISGNRYFGGISALLYNVYSHIDREQVQFDFLYPYISTNGIYKEKIETMGGRVYELGITGNKVDRKAKLYPGIRQFLKEHPYEVVHINSGNLLFNLIVSKAARDAGIGTIIVHSHNADAANESKLKQRAIGALKPLLDRQLTARFACSDEAARHMFTEKAVAGNGVTVVRNGIEVQRFLYDEQARGEVRRRLGIENKHVVGHIGRFCPQKNQVFLIR
ncbi:MAG: glycosyltransferase, partial [Clostridia bacterium]|nr:glycosyltransferase [Clostridia bacterium]